MSEYIVSARKYRPQNFLTVVGQKGLVQTLKNAIASGKLAHAYLFCGPRGVGKTTCARIFAKTINCEHRTPEGEACESCESCQSFHEQRSYNIYELDAASNNSVDNIRDLIEQVQMPPQIGRYKVFIIDEVHMLSNQAFNAFLKTLEEPPKHAIFVMCTTEKQKILPTILSRCQTYDFQRITLQDIVAQLAMIAGQEGIKAEPQALQVIARKADGGMRDALSIFDQIASFTAGNVTYQATIDNLNILDYETFFRVTDACIQGNVPASLVILDQVIRRGFDPQYFIGGLAGHIRDLMVAQDPATLGLIEAGAELAQRYQQQTVQCTPYFLYNALQIANDCDFNYRNSRNKRLSVELALIRICQLLHPVQQPPQQQPLQSIRPAVAAAPAQQVAAAPAQQVVAAPVASTSAQSARPMQPRQAVSQTPPPAPQPAAQPKPQQAPSAFAPRPATQGAPVTAVPATGGRFAPRAGGAAGPFTASLRGGQPQASPIGGGAASSAASAPVQNEPIQEDALRRVWKEYIAGIPSEKLLQNAMMSATLTLVEGKKLVVSVLEGEPADRIRQHLETLAPVLRQRLRNSSLTIEVQANILESQGISRAYTPREKLTEMMDSNKELFQNLIDTFGLELA